MTTDSLCAIRIAPESAWAARLGRAGRGLELPPFDQTALNRSLSTLGIDPAPVSDQGAWMEDFLWNELLPRQRANGRFSGDGDDTAHEACRAALEAILARSIQWTDEEVSVSLAVPSAGSFQAPGARHQSGAHVRWKLETDYPRAGAGAITFFSESPVDFIFSLRLPATAQAVQITRNGATCDLNVQDGMIRLPGPWQSGDSVRFGFGLPFRILRTGQNPVTDRALDRAYPGAPSIEGAVLYHGARALAPLRAGSESRDGADQPPVAMGVRKDGVFRLSPASIEQIEALQSPFAARGDLFRSLLRSTDAEPILLIARSLWASVTNSPLPPPIPIVEFAPYETSFDRGA